jgi:hypothetical protein
MSAHHAPLSPILYQILGVPTAQHLAGHPDFSRISKILDGKAPLPERPLQGKVLAVLKDAKVDSYHPKGTDVPTLDVALENLFNLPDLFDHPATDLKEDFPGTEAAFRLQQVNFDFCIKVLHAIVWVCDVRHETYVPNVLMKALATVLCSKIANEFQFIEAPDPKNPKAKIPYDYRMLLDGRSLWWNEPRVLRDAAYILLCLIIVTGRYDLSTYDDEYIGM